MTEPSAPVILAVDDERPSLAGIEAALSRRFGSDYDVVSDTSPEPACSSSRTCGPADATWP